MKTIKPQDLEIIQVEYDINGEPKLAKFYLKDNKEFFLKIDRTERLDIPDKVGFYVNLYLTNNK